MNIDWDSLVLARGNHTSPADGVCLLEAVAYVAGEPHTDHPACVSPVLGAFGRAWNDALDDEWRQRLKPFIPRMIGTAGDGHDETRAWLATDWLVRVHAPAWLRLIGRHDLADALERCAPILSAQAALDAQPLLGRARRESAAARAAALATANAARAAALAAARAAANAASDAALAAALAAANAARLPASVAAWATAYAANAAASVAALAAASVAANAASDTANAAASVAALAAADAATDAASDAATKALAPTRDALRESAMDLFERLIALGEESRRAVVHQEGYGKQ